ncbi:hypothetical protein VP01_45g8 [Puccinia sorghi]|uniref:HAT C-terminal dimerisation domain-containing protein n=1 Tax=Puccinia sorghi TaxID=27349 RepID=A0A0L6UPA7_9BASI|nr:hypothetical protein VP01_45g8 [Puccinia sorghi]
MFWKEKTSHFFGQSGPPAIQPTTNTQMLPVKACYWRGGRFWGSGVHSGKKFAELFHDALKKYLAVDFLHTITANNASVNSKMACKLERQIPHFESATHILGCVAHIINLAAKVGISALGPINNHLDGDKILMATTSTDIIGPHWMNITLLVSTPNGVGINAQTINKHIHRLCTWWDQAQGIMKLIEPLSDTTNVLCASKYPTLNNALPVYIVLLEHLHMAFRDPRFKTLFWKTHQDFITEHYHLSVDEIIQIFKTIEQEFYNNIATQQKTLPNLELMAHQYLCIPATSASSERVFSKGCRNCFMAMIISSLRPSRSYCV